GWSSTEGERDLDEIEVKAYLAELILGGIDLPHSRIDPDGPQIADETWLDAQEDLVIYEVFECESLAGRIVEDAVARMPASCFHQSPRAPQHGSVASGPV